MKLIVGLGNPGKRYENTRHNVGFRVVRAFAAEYRLRVTEKAKVYLLGTGELDGRSIHVAFPRTFMNASGVAVKELLRITGAKPSDMAVVHDDMDLALGRIQVRVKGGHGGHKGIISILTSLQTDRFMRLRVGIGKPPPHEDPSDFVLDSFDEHEQSLFQSVLECSVQALHCMVTEGAQSAMDRFNGRLVQEAS